MERGVVVSTSKAPARIAGMFDSIAHRYDTLNHLLSVGLDKRWRARAVRELALTGTDDVLDMCTGTADLAVEAVTSPAGRARDVVGVDFAGEMLRRGLVKIRKAGLADRIHLVRGDATNVPLPAARFDAAMVAFGIRNVLDPSQAIRELARVLKPGGRLVINAIRKEAGDRNELLGLDYARDLWLEKEVKSVANVTRRDVAEFLELAAEAQLRPEYQVFPLAEANQALRELKTRRIRGGKVLLV